MTCSVLELHDLLGKTWTYPLLFNLTSEPQGFNELWRKSGRRINQTLLSERLSALERFGLIRAKDGYAITPRGEKLRALLDEMRAFVKEQDPTVCETCEDCPAYSSRSR